MGWGGGATLFALQCTSTFGVWKFDPPSSGITVQSGVGWEQCNSVSGSSVQPPASRVRVRAPPLAASDEQLDFPVVFASGIRGVAGFEV